MIEEGGWIGDLFEEESKDNIKNFDEINKSLSQIKKQGNRCKDITYKLLSFARKTELETDDVDINSLINDVISFSKQRAKYARVNIKSELANLPIIKISPSEIQQVLLNVFNNAIDGLMYIRIADLPESTVKPVMEEFQAELESKLNDENSKTI